MYDQNVIPYRNRQFAEKLSKSVKNAQCHVNFMSQCIYGKHVGYKNAWRFLSRNYSEIVLKC
jgi:hypothetical protein